MLHLPPSTSGVLGCLSPPGLSLPLLPTALLQLPFSERGAGSQLLRPGSSPTCLGFTSGGYPDNPNSVGSLRVSHPDAGFRRRSSQSPLPRWDAHPVGHRSYLHLRIPVRVLPGTGIRFPICLLATAFRGPGSVASGAVLFPPGVSALGKLAVGMLRISVVKVPDGAQVIAVGCWGGQVFCVLLGR